MHIQSLYFKLQGMIRKYERLLKDFIKDQNCRFGLVINNDESPRLYDEQIAGIPFTCL